MVDKFFLVLENDTWVQVPFAEWESYEEGDEFPRPTPASPTSEDREVDRHATTRCPGEC